MQSELVNHVWRHLVIEANERATKLVLGDAAVTVLVPVLEEPLRSSAGQMHAHGEIEGDGDHLEEPYDRLLIGGEQSAQLLHHGHLP